MPDFSERYGYVQKPIQVENMSEELRNRIWNTYRCEIYIDTDDPYNQVYSNYLEEIMDACGVAYSGFGEV